MKSVASGRTCTRMKRIIVCNALSCVQDDFRSTIEVRSAKKLEIIDSPGAGKNLEGLKQRATRKRRHDLSAFRTIKDKRLAVSFSFTRSPHFRVRRHSFVQTCSTYLTVSNKLRNSSHNAFLIESLTVQRLLNPSKIPDLKPENFMVVLSMCFVGKK